MSTRQQIDEILRLRHEKAKGLEEQKQKLKDLLAELKKVNGMKIRSGDIKNDELRADFIRKHKALGLQELMKQTEEAIGELDTVITRFNRDYLSIATIGKERQGKSQFLQSVSQLDDRVIPAYAAGSCTGAVSIIKNDPNMSPNTVRAEINYRQRDDIIEFAREYVRTINPSYPVNEIDFDTIEYLPLSQLEKAADNAPPENVSAAQAAMKHLRNIVNSFADISSKFGASPETYTDPEIIKTIVAQNNGKKDSDPDIEYYNNYLAVQKADIQCKFFYDPGKVRLIDTVGIESTQAGVIQAMLDTVKNECDAAIVVTRPEASPQTKDIEINNLLMTSFADKMPEKWLFYLVNHFKGHNDNTVDVFDRDIAKWKIAGHMIVDCSDARDVNERFMKSLLDTLLANIDAIDSTYVKSAEDARQKLAEAAKRILDAVGSGESVAKGGVMEQMALNKGKACFNAMGVQLRKIVHQWSRDRNEPNPVLWKEIQKILNSLENEVNPGREAIQRIAETNNVLAGDIWNICLHYVRNKITKQFIDIDEELIKENIRFKNSLVRVFYENLQSLFGEAGDVNDDSVDLTEKLLEKVRPYFGEDEKYAQIYDAIVFLNNFQFNTRAAIIQTVRSQLNIINPLCEEFANPTMNFTVQNCGVQIDYFLTSRLSLIEENLRHELMEIYSTPNRAFFAVAEEFYDRLTFAAVDISSGVVKSMSDIWGEFFVEYARKIWQEQGRDFEIIDAFDNEVRKTLCPLLSAIDQEGE